MFCPLQARKARQGSSDRHPEIRVSALASGFRCGTRVSILLNPIYNRPECHVQRGEGSIRLVPVELSLEEQVLFVSHSEE